MFKVYVSPSMQEHNAGATPGYIEENVMNKIADALMPKLKAHGIEAYRNNPLMTLEQMAADSNLRKPNIHVAIHSDATGVQGSTTRGCSAFYKTAEGKGLAQSIYNRVSALTPTTDRGVALNEHLYELNNTDAVAALIEVDFHDNIDGAKWIENDINEIAEAFTHGICDYFGIPFKASPTLSNNWIKGADGNWYFYENGQKVKNAWRKDSVDWCYCGADGAAVKNTWMQDSSKKWFYLGPDYRILRNTWQKDSQGLCHLGADGAWTGERK